MEDNAESLDEYNRNDLEVHEYENGTFTVIPQKPYLLNNISGFGRTREEAILDFITKINRYHAKCVGNISVVLSNAEKLLKDVEHSQ